MSDTAATDRRRLLELMLAKRGLAPAAGGPAEPAPRERPAELPMSYAQQRLWFISQLYPGSAVYNVTGAIRLRGPLDVERLRGALQRVVDRHEALRTGLADGLQVIAEAVTVELPVVRAEDPWPALRAHAAEPFDLERPPLLRCLLVEVAEQEHLLGLSVHHVVADGWSLGILTGELSDLYAGREPAPLPLQYADYALWQREASLDDDLAWWRDRLAGAPPVLELPADRPPPPQQSFEGANHVLELPDVRALASAHGATEFQVLLAGFAALLQRLTGQEDIVVGTPVAGRTRPEIEPLIGFFVNTLALRVDLTGDPAFAELLDRVRETALSAADHQDVPFDRLVEELGAARDLSVPPVYQVLLAFQNAPPPELDLEGLEIEFLPLEPEGARLPLAVDVVGRRATLNYSTARFDAETVEDLGRRWVRLLEAAAADPRTPLSRLAIAGADEPAAVLRGAAAPPAPRVPDAIAAQPPGAPALEGMTFGELNARADARAAELGPRHGQLVPVPAVRGPEHVVEALAVWRAGGAFTTARDCAAAGRDAAGLAYAVRTSGSTGQPKLVGVGHAALANACAWHARKLGLAPGERAAQTFSLEFDASLLDLWGSLAAGAEVRFAPEDARLDGGRLAEWMAAEAITVGSAPSALVPGLFAMPKPEALRSFFTGGEPIAADVPAGLALSFDYGPTEAAIVATAAEDFGSIGTPIDGLSAYVLDGDLRPVPAGVTGELYLGGAGVARGYLGMPGMTAERFLPDPFAAEGDRMYRTGDLARLRRDGRLEFRGRADEQLKVRGHRIEPGEVEAALRSHPDVAEAAVVRAGDRLVAAVVAGAPPAALREHVAGRVPAYMVPQAFLHLDALPLTASGKVDRRRLAALDAPAVAARGAERPRTPTEQALAAIWAEVLGSDGFGRGDDFFAVGGHSLLATQVVARLRDRLGLELPLRVLFEASTLGALGAAVDEAMRAPAIAAPPPPRPVGRDEPLPLSFSQQRLWFLDQMEPASHAYNLPVAVRLQGPLDRHAMERAVRALVARHESLRTTFTTVKGEPRQVVSADVPVPFSVMDLAHVPPDEREHQLDQALAEEASRPFDLAVGPLLRCTLIRLAEDEHVLALCMHHVVSDGWSLGILADELSALYAGRPLPPLPIQYPDYAVWQREWLQGEELERQIAHFKQALAGAPAAIELPTDRPRPPVITPNGLTHSWTVPRELAARVDALAAAESATPFMVLLAAWAALLARMSGQDDIVVGTPIANRRHSETEGLIGFFVNTLVLRTDVGGDPSFRELVRRTREASLDAYAHQDLPFEKLVDAMSPARDLSMTPIFQVAFAVQNASDPHFRFGEAEAEFEQVEATVAKFDLSLDVFDSGDGHVTSINYRTDLFDPETIEALATRWEATLREVTGAPERRVSQLEILGEGERARLEALAGDGAPYEAGVLVHEAFERHADAAPDAVALIFEGESMAYGELEAAANRLANRLRAAGVGTEDRVGLLLERGFGLIVGVLGILKSGAAYVPVDTGYPDVRVAFTLRDAGVRLAVTDMPERLPEGIQAVAPDGGDDPSRPPRAADPRSLAYVIYTSGSTGVPKGVGVEHRSVLNLVAALSRSFAPGPEDRVLQFPSIGFDAAVWDIVMALSSGASLVLATRADLLPGRDLLRTMADGEVTIAMLQPTAAAALPPGELPHLRLLLIGGEALTSSLGQRWAKVTRTVNAYGPTEATVACTWHEIEFTGQAGLSSPPIGRPIANAPARVLDRHGNPVPLGVAGELHVGGVALARGYLGRPGLTAERFVPDPWGEPGSRLYRTGDLVRFTRDGELEFLGRVDRQVKLRGFRIELGEIETALQALPAVADAVAIVREDQPGDRRLVAYVVPRPDAQPSIPELRAHVGRQLPDHMMPSAFVLLDALPLTVNHKVDRDALPPPTAERPELEAAYTPARDERERALAKIWADVLGLDRVGIFDNFFDLGGDSILAIQVVSRANDAGVKIAAKHLFQAQTIYDLGLLDSARAFLEPDQGLITGPVPLTPIQRWFLAQEQPDLDHFNQAVVLAGEDVDPELLRRTLGHLAWQHDALRLRVVRGVDGDFHQRLVEPVDDGVLEVVDGTVAEHAERIQSSLDLANGPIFRAVWFPDEAQLLLVAHHMCVDAVSWPILIEDLNDFYEQLAEGAPEPDLPPKSTSLRWWANRLAEHARTSVLHAELDRWLAAIPREVAPLPRDGDGENTVGASRTLTSFVGADATAALTGLGVFDTLVYALGAAVAEWAGDERGALLALEAHGREEIFDGANLFATVGWFTNVYPLWVPSAGGLEAAREARAAVPANGFGYGLLRHMTDAGKRLAALPQPEIALNYLGRVEGGFTGGARFAPTFGDAGPVMSPRNRRPFPLDVGAQVMSSGLQLQWTYAAGLHEEATIVDLATRVTTLLEELAR